MVGCFIKRDVGFRVRVYRSIGVKRARDAASQGSETMGTLYKRSLLNPTCSRWLDRSGFYIETPWMDKILEEKL